MVVESKQGRGQASETRGLEFMVGEISEGVEGESVTRIGHLVVLGDKDMVILEHFESVLFLFFRRVCIVMFFAPAFEEFRGVGRGSQRERSEEEDKRYQKGTPTTHTFGKCFFPFYFAEFGFFFLLKNSEERVRAIYGPALCIWRTRAQMN